MNENVGSTPTTSTTLQGSIQCRFVKSKAVISGALKARSIRLRPVLNGKPKRLMHQAINNLERVLDEV